MAQGNTNKFLVNPSNQLDHEKILSNWDEYLAPAPMGIAIMSQLLIYTNRLTGFVIISIIDKKFIPLINHPLSFHKTLKQISDESYEAFMLAHNNMKMIQLQVGQVPDYIKEFVKLIQSNKKNSIEKLLSVHLKRIEKAAADGLKYSTQIRDAFHRLGRLFEQVIFVVESSQGDRKEEIKESIQKSIEKEKNLHINVEKEVDADEMIDLLEEGRKKLVELNEKWAGMSMYFEAINRYIDKVMKKHLDDFVRDAELAKQETTYFLHLTNDSIAKSLESSTKSRHIAVTYVKVSDNYIMKPLKRMREMARMLSFEPAKLEETQDELLELCREAMQGIKEMGNEDRNKTVREMENQVKSIQN